MTKLRPSVIQLTFLLGRPLCPHMLFILAFTGCDTTSRNLSKMIKISNNMYLALLTLAKHVMQ